MVRRYGPVAIMLLIYVLVLSSLGRAVHARHHDPSFVAARTLLPNSLVRDADVHKPRASGAGDFWKVREIERTVIGRYTKVEVQEGGRIEPKMLRDTPVINGKTGQLIAVSLKDLGGLVRWINAGTRLLLKCVEHCDSFEAEVVTVVCGGTTATGQAPPCAAILKPKSAATKFDASSKFDVVILQLP